jgi:hypothetical protein
MRTTMNVIDKNFPLFFTGFLVSAMAIPLLAAGCVPEPTPETQARALEEAVKSINEDMVVIKPRPGVECYILRSRRTDVPHAMSCVTIPF